MRIVLVFDEQTDIPSSVLFPHPSSKRTSRTVFPTKIEQVDVRLNFVQEEPMDLQCLTMILVICVENDVSIFLDILTLEF